MFCFFVIVYSFGFYFVLFLFVLCMRSQLWFVSYQLASWSKQPLGVQRVSTNSSANGCKPPIPLPSSTSDKSSALKSLIHQSPNGGYVSLLRQAISTLDNAEGNSSAVRFNSLQRPNRGVTNISQRSNHQFRSMRSISNKNDANKTINYLSIVREKEKNNNNTTGTESNKNKEKYDGHVRKDVERSLTLTSALPKPAPRTRVPSASVPQPSLAHHETYENLQQLMNGDGVVGNKVCNYGPHSSWYH